MYKVDNLKLNKVGFRCDRVSCLGNPFIMSSEAERKEVIEQHKKFFNIALLSPKLYESLDLNSKYKKVSRYHYLEELGKALQNKTFLCWCSPKSCHCDNYVEFAKCTRVVISGSRSITDHKFIFEKLDTLLQKFNKEHNTKYLIGGEARGVDSAISKYAESRGWLYIPVKPEWDLYGKSAGYKRNLVMLNLASHFIAIWDGKSRGTNNVIDIATRLDLPLRIVYG